MFVEWCFPDFDQRHWTVYYTPFLFLVVQGVSKENLFVFSLLCTIFALFQPGTYYARSHVSIFVSFPIGELTLSIYRFQHGGRRDLRC